MRTTDGWFRHTEFHYLSCNKKNMIRHSHCSVPMCCRFISSAAQVSRDFFTQNFEALSSADCWLETKQALGMNAWRELKYDSISINPILEKPTTLLNRKQIHSLFWSCNWVKWTILVDVSLYFSTRLCLKGHFILLPDSKHSSELQYDSININPILENPTTLLNRKQIHSLFWSCNWVKWTILVDVSLYFSTGLCLKGHFILLPDSKHSTAARYL